MSNFTKFQPQTENGGALRLINTEVNCNTSYFISCESYQGGGAIYIDNELNIKTDINLRSNYFERCKAVYGGALYIASIQNPISVYYCIFISNKATGIYLSSAYNGIIMRCTFRHYIGAGGSVKIINDYKSSGRKMINQLVYHKSLSIEECDFDIDSESECLISYILKNIGFC